MAVRAMAKGIRISSTKLRPVIDTVRGKSVEEALDILRFLPTPAAAVVAKVVRSAAANAENNLMLSPAQLRVVEVYANQAPTMKRFRAAPRGRMRRIKKRSSHITVVVDEEGS